MVEERRRRVNELFHAALEHEPETRLVFLESACGEDTDLRHQVELLLAKQEKAGSFLETPAIAYTAVNQTATMNPPTRQFGAYRIVSPLGAGGMGQVFRAHDSKLGRDVAVKFLPAEFARDPDRLARFRREARTLASLNHPYIGAIFGLEEDGDLECLVLELVEGETLHGPLPVATALEYARQVAEALEGAHAKGIIHRDLKPSNVKLTPWGQVKVPDFGLAKAIREPEQTDASPAAGTELVTLAGHIVGTPGYMSPEQAKWQRGRRADRYLGIRMPPVRVAHRQARICRRDSAGHDGGGQGTGAGLGRAAAEDSAEDYGALTALRAKSPGPSTAKRHRSARNRRANAASRQPLAMGRRGGGTCGLGRGRLLDLADFRAAEQRHSRSHHHKAYHRFRLNCLSRALARRQTPRLLLRPRK
jgi:hypothetical protein